MRALLRLALGAALGACAAACGGGRSAGPAVPAAGRRPDPGREIVRTARAYLPEEDGGRTAPRSESDFVRRVFAEHGIELPRTVAEQSLKGARVAREELKAGDLVFFCGQRLSRIAEHVAIYFNNGIIIQHRPSLGVHLENINSEYYRARYVTARRLVN